MKHIVLNRETCTGCDTCESVCALGHEGVVSPRLARLRIYDHFVEGHRIEGYVCRQCSGAECLIACRNLGAKAMSVDRQTGAKVIDPATCDGCQACVRACPQFPNTPIYFDPARNISIKCDLCGGDPLCVKYCPEGSLTLSLEAAHA
jgi:Fe-S-cluster-containing hydrogenase component 2